MRVKQTAQHAVHSHTSAAVGKRTQSMALHLSMASCMGHFCRLTSGCLLQCYLKYCCGSLRGVLTWPMLCVCQSTPSVCRVPVCRPTHNFMPALLVTREVLHRKQQKLLGMSHESAQAYAAVKLSIAPWCIITMQGLSTMVHIWIVAVTS